MLQADVGRFADVGSPYLISRLSPSPAPDGLVWRINLGTVRGMLDGEGAIIILDFQHGGVVQVWDWVS